MKKLRMKSFSVTITTYSKEFLVRVEAIDLGEAIGKAIKLAQPNIPEVLRLTASEIKEII